MDRRWRPSRRARPGGRCLAEPRPRWRLGRPYGGGSPGRSSSGRRPSRRERFSGGNRFQTRSRCCVQLRQLPRFPGEVQHQRENQEPVHHMQGCDSLHSVREHELDDHEHGKHAVDPSDPPWNARSEREHDSDQDCDADEKAEKEMGPEGAQAAKSEYAVAGQVELQHDCRRSKPEPSHIEPAHIADHQTTPASSLAADSIRPSRIRTVRCARSATCGLWVTSTMVWPSLFMRTSSSTITLVTSESRLPVGSVAPSESRLPAGSSAQTTAGLWTNARATATRCCSPPESWSGRWLARWARPSVSSISSARRRESRELRF